MSTLYAGHTTTRDNADLDALWAKAVEGANAYPVDGRTDTSLAQYLANNAVFNPRDYGAPIDGVASAAAAFAFAVTKAALVDGTVMLYPGTYLLDSNVTVPANVTLNFFHGGKLSIAAAKTLTVNGPLVSPRRQIFTGSGATVLTNAMLVDGVYPEWWGAKGDGVTVDTSAIQKAIDTTRTVVFADKTYPCVGLTQGTTFQRLVGQGAATKLIKSGNGDLLTLNGNYVLVERLVLRGDAATPVYTGNNLVVNGINCIVRVGSLWAYGRAIKFAGGGRIVIEQGPDIIQTADTSGTGYDIEIGTSGVATLYCRLVGIYTSQNTGGILLVDTGSAEIEGGQFGKLYIKKGTGPAGVNGGSTRGSRILNDVTIEASNASFVGIEAGGSVDMYFAVGTALCTIDETSVFGVGSTVTNDGNANNLIRRNASGGSVSKIKWGEDTALYIEEIDHDAGHLELPGNLYIKNAKNLNFRNSTGASVGTISMSAGNNWGFTQNAAGDVQIQTPGGGGTLVGGAGQKVGLYGLNPLITKGAALTAADASTVDATYGNEERDVINNLRTRLNELETRVKAFNMIS